MASGGDTAAASLIDDTEFDRRMRRLGPFERKPDVAVAVSGGPDSLCLAFLMQRWTENLAGRCFGLIVDHGLRGESRDEARAVQRQLRALGLSAEVLRWTGDKPQRNVQAAARVARYALLLDWCCDHNAIHLALGHHAGDQAETHLLRRRAGSGANGLAAMAPISERGGTRILRPVLDLPPERLRATLTNAGLSWVDDPSNRDLRYTRTQLRREIRAAGQVSRLCAEAERYARKRAARDHRIAGLLVKSARLFPTGHAILNPTGLAKMAPEDGRQCLARIVACIGARDYPPRTARLDALRRNIVENCAKGGRTLGGCQFLRLKPDAMLVCREPKAATNVVSIRAGAEGRWDDRFSVLVAGDEENRASYTISRLDDRAWGALRRRFPDAARTLIDCCGPVTLPAQARAALPVLCDLDGPCALPHLPKQRARPETGRATLEISFRPRRPLAGASFAVGDR